MLALLDDPNVADTEILYRRASWEKIGGRGKTEPGQIAKIHHNFFSDYPKEAAERLGYSGPCMSVGLHSVIEQSGHRPEKMLENFPEFGLLMITVGELRRLKRASGEPCPQGILASATLAEPWHGVVFDLESPPRRDPAKKAIAMAADWLVPLIG